MAAQGKREAISFHIGFNIFIPLLKGQGDGFGIFNTSIKRCIMFYQFNIFLS